MALLCSREKPLHVECCGGLTQLWVVSPRHATVPEGGSSAAAEGQRALQLMDRPGGPPTTYGPMPKENRQVDVNPFW